MSSVIPAWVTGVGGRGNAHYASSATSEGWPCAVRITWKQSLADSLASIATRHVLASTNINAHNVIESHILHQGVQRKLPHKISYLATTFQFRKCNDFSQVLVILPDLVMWTFLYLSKTFMSTATFSKLKIWAYIIIKRIQEPFKTLPTSTMH